MKPAIKQLHVEHNAAFHEMKRLSAELSVVDSRLDEVAKLQNAMEPVQTAPSGDVETLIQYRLAEQARLMRVDVLAELKNDLESQQSVLKSQLFQAKLACNRVAAGAWTALAESLVAEHGDLLRQVAQVTEKAGWGLPRWIQELPDLTPNEVATIEADEEFPAWI